LNTMLLFLLARRLIKHGPGFLSKLTAALFVGLMTFYGATIPHTLAGKAVFDILMLLAFAFTGWFWALAPDERALIRNFRMRRPAWPQG